MSRSTVAVALKAEIAILLPPGLRNYLNNRASTSLVTEDGHAFWLLEDIKWDLAGRFFAEDQCALGKFFNEFGGKEHEHYIVREANYDDSSYEGGDWGSWDGNPWGIARVVSAEIYYENVGINPNPSSPQ